MRVLAEGAAPGGRTQLRGLARVLFAVTCGRCCPVVRSALTTFQGHGNYRVACSRSLCQPAPRVKPR